MENIVPVKIRPHLIPFFYSEFEGVDAHNPTTKAKACKITKTSSLGFMLVTALRPTDTPAKPNKYYIYITFEDDLFDSKFYSVANGKNCFLEVPEFVNDQINNLLEDQFRIAFVYFVKGMLRSNPDLLVHEAISEFMVEYELDEYGFELESMRRILNRNSRFKLSRLQSKVTNRVFGYNKTVS